MSRATRATIEPSTARMRLGRIVLAICLTVVADCGGTTLTRKTRTIPFDLSPTRLLQPVARYLKLPRDAAVGLYRLVAGPRDAGKKMVFEFRPDDGPRASHDYQRRFGYRGQRLVELLGLGFSPNDRGPVPSLALAPPPPNFRYFA